MWTHSVANNVVNILDSTRLQTHSTSFQLPINYFFCYGYRIQLCEVTARCLGTPMQFSSQK